MIETLIRQYVHFTRLAHTGFNQCKCEVCGDYTDRGGFKFDGNEIGYNCFNCGVGAKYTEHSGKMGKNFREVLKAFGIPNDEINKELGKSFLSQKASEKEVISLSDVTKSQEKKIHLITPEIELPPSFKLIGSTSEHFDTQEAIVSYLLARKIDVTKYKFYFSTSPKQRSFVFIPFFRNGKLIFWQGRNILPNCSKKDRYDNCSSPKENIIFNFDELYRSEDTPLFVTEGVFDAMPINGIAIIGSKLNDAKIEALRRSKRRKIFVIDKDKNGAMVAEKALTNKWEITFAPQFTEDVNKSIIQYGYTWTIHQLFKNIPKNEFEARLKVKLLCN